MHRVVLTGLAVGLAIGLLTGCVAASEAPAPHEARGLASAGPAIDAPAPPENPTPIEVPVPTPGPPAGEDGGVTGGGDVGGLPQGLEAAVRRDLGLTPEQYLADAAAAGRASDIVPELEKGGIRADQVWMDGSTITVQATTAAQRTLVASLGATPTTDAPPAAPAPVAPTTAYDDLDDGLGWYLRTGGSTISICSTGFNGYAAGGAPTMATAGHCLRGNTPVPSDPVVASRYLQSAPNQQGTAGPIIGTLASNTFMFGGGDDSGLIPVTGANLTPRGRVSTWNGSTLPVRGLKNATVGAPICKSGRTTGWTCGVVTRVNFDQKILGDGGAIVSVNSVSTTMCMWHGDSGGPAMIGSFAVGINSSGNWSTPGCTNAGGYSAIYPLGGDANSVTQKQAGWQLQVTLDTPVIASTEGGAAPTVSGTVPNATTGTSVSLYLDGSSTASATTGVSATGAWSFAPTGLSTGVHTVSVTATYGSYNRSSPSPTAYLPVGITSSRVFGSDRADTSVQVSQKAFPAGARTVYLANGWNFPDALVATAAAAKQGGPVLLAPTTGISAAVRAEIQRLAPDRIVVVGGPVSLSAELESSLAGLAPAIDRIAGGDRFDTARRIVTDAFGGTSVATLYVASGVGFPDSLSASAAAGATGAPVLTVLGGAAALDAATVSTITALHPARITVVGGVSAVSAGIAAQLGTLAPTTRIGGDDRFSTSQLVARSVYPSAQTVYLASGVAFPDALTGSGLAAVAAQPLLLTMGGCVPATVPSSMAGWGATAVTLIGGPNALAPEVAALRSC
ncbi:cell wall-binding repeat-containing protein [Leifsonia sp. ZF2019]|uniref:cell wall-binding repeat-containing protein n=1 Tax=Leifsonia sp. ZF2019 TaxID=2781978 RepID=UPI001CC0DE2A|nr:cell wall-binding repeat-containing protein [Leifsonia sp. ZF2019]UAJ78462.1 cell wall-binding repeat-containing protein [Leifsonia sp. ZF2019]